jgi:hypothetical protein
MSHNKYIVKALVDAVTFLEFSDENVIDPDAAVAAMEQMGAVLQEMSVDERREFADVLSKLSE